MTVVLHTGCDDDWKLVLEAKLPGVSIGGRGSKEAAAAPVVLVDNPNWSDLERYDGALLVQSTFAGPDNLGGSKRPDNLLVARTSGGGLATAMSEYVLAAVMSAHRQMPHYRQAQNQGEWVASPGQPVAKDRTVGVLGFGELARPAAELLSVVGFRVIAAARSPRSSNIELRTGTSGLASVIAESDILVNLLPLTSETVGILGRAALATMKPGASLVNCGRGPHVDLEALLGTLDSGAIGHAWLDVFDLEPLPANHPAWHNPSITITPHIAAESSPELVGSQVAENIARFLRGDTPTNLL